MTKVITSYDQVPWYRRNWFASLLVGLGIFFPPLLLVACLLLVTGDIYQEYTKDGKMQTWSKANKVAAWIILAIQVIALGYALRVSWAL